ncbi:MAG TPA: hypothetical protein VMD55_09960 [Terracidiphilus sp.]|jgi:hypothetical protein|nr:hypothetical protein [Terracidiphilus sp.]
MKNKIVPELISATLLGIGFGVIVNHTHEKWHRLGRDAFLAHEAQTFENLYSRRAPWPHELLIWTLVALIVFAVYKALALLIARILE